MQSILLRIRSNLIFNAPLKLVKISMDSCHSLLPRMNQHLPQILPLLLDTLIHHILDNYRNYQPFLIMLDPFNLIPHPLAVLHKSILDIFILRRRAPLHMLLRMLTDASRTESNETVSCITQHLQSAQKLVIA